MAIQNPDHYYYYESPGRIGNFVGQKNIYISNKIMGKYETKNQNHKRVENL